MAAHDGVGVVWVWVHLLREKVVAFEACAHSEPARPFREQRNATQRNAESGVEAIRYLWGNEMTSPAAN